MVEMPLFFSLLFFASFACYLFFGIYIIRANSRAALNRVFLALCISLCFWSLGFSLANSAPDLETCFFWRRLSALGWGSVYSVLLHYLILLTAGNHNRLYRKLYPLLYLPAAISIYAFSLSHKITATQFNFVRTDYGWVNMAVQNGWTLFFNFYYITYLLACLLVIWRWKRGSSDKNIHKQANILFASTLAALLLGSMTDVVLNAYFAGPLPQMGPLVTLIPTAAIYYSIRRYRMMQVASENRDELILDEESRARFHYNLSSAFLVGGLLSFLSLFLPHMISGGENLRSTILTGIIFFVLGFAILVFRLIKAENMRNTLILIITLISIPAITLRFLQFACITVWVFPIILMIVALVFNTRLPLLLITATAVITQIIVWSQTTDQMIQMDQFDFIIRIGIFIVAFWLGSIVNSIYTRRLRETVHQIDFQKIISEISFDFMSINRENFDEKINNLLNRTGSIFHADRSYVFLIDLLGKTMTNTHEWYKAGSEPIAEPIKDIPLEAFPWWMEQLKSHKLIYIEDVSKLSAEAGAEKARLTRQNIKSTVSILIEDNGEIRGFMGFDSISSFKPWPAYQTKQLSILANLLANGLQKIKVEKEIEFMAFYDHLTGLANRTLFTDRLTQAVNLAGRNERFIAVIFMDIDSFKTVNDIIGHSGGDTIIKEVAQSLAGCLRKTDTVARFGGDEFLILVNNIQENNDIITIADKIMDIFKTPFNVEGYEFFITSSAGIAVYPLDGEDAETLIKNADIAMYKAKYGGKNQYALCTAEMKEEVKKNMVLSNNLYRALERNELMVYYQPQIRLQTGQVAGLEALLRWKHSAMGIIPPGVFIPLAEKNGLINSIGEWVLRTAISQNKEWQDKGLARLRVAVNLSIIQFNNPHIVDIIARILRETDLKPEYLELEITEGIAIKEVHYTTNILNRLKELGVSISIDDFGTEYSSLSRIKMLPIDRIKIDMQFVQGIENSVKDQAITKVIITLAKSLGLDVLAEGVETAPQLEFLNQKMCDEVQGYYFYKPMPAKEVEKLLRSAAGGKLSPG